MKTLVLFSLRAFHFFSPLRNQVLVTVFGFSSPCKYKQSCSEYTICQIQKHGTITGLKNGWKRTLSCHN